jgi:UDPglucose--hexose-1-phosphate uridylyltransferase
MNEIFTKYPHRRLNILTGEWILVSPGRLKRPWLGKTESSSQTPIPEYDPNCYMCPGNIRASGVANPNYKRTFVFDNDFPALLPNTPDKSNFNGNDLLHAHTEQGICRVVCFSPKHNLTLAEMDITEISFVIDTWIEQYIDLGKKEFINYVLIFENKGEIMGTSNPHPHCQIWAEKSIPVEPQKEIKNMQNYFDKKKKCILCDYLTLELNLKERIVCENDDFLTLVPFWSIWPYETMILPKDHLGSLTELNSKSKFNFADILKRTLVKYDNLFNIPFPYSAGIHQKPTDGISYEEFHLHMHFYPPLLRSDKIRKFMVGYEMFGNPQRDITPEESAEKLKNLPEIHYKELKIK